MSAPVAARDVLEAAANQILTVVAPTTARLVRATFTFDASVDTAMTDGIRIWLPPVFEGLDVATHTAIGIGLLVHELGHFLQPLQALSEAERDAGAPHWLGNIIADIQLEAMMAYLFSPLAITLVEVRRAIKAGHFADYVADMRRGRTLADMACSVALAGRFGAPETSFEEGRPSLPNGLWNALFANGLHAGPEGPRVVSFAQRLAEAKLLAPAEVPDFVRQVMQEFPELRTARESFPPPAFGSTTIRGAGRAVQAEAVGNTAAHSPQAPTPVQRITAARSQPRAAALAAARTLRLHFRGAPAATEIVAPGRLDRRAAALGEPVPLRMQLPGREQPRPKVVICLDKSGSMKGAKFELAQTAAQAVALAVRDSGGEVIGVLFDDMGEVAGRSTSAPEDDTLLYAAPSSLTYGGTAFEFLTDAWRRWPHHLFLLVTDGDGSNPPALPGDRARTSAILVPPDCDPDVMAQIAARVHTLSDLRGLADVLTLLVPRS